MVVRESDDLLKIIAVGLGCPQESCGGFEHLAMIIGWEFPGGFPPRHRQQPPRLALMFLGDRSPARLFKQAAHRGPQLGLPIAVLCCPILLSKCEELWRGIFFAGRRDKRYTTGHED